MPIEEPEEVHCCPKCCGTDIEPGSVTYSYDPRKARRADEAAPPDFIEKKFRCRTCDAEFHVIERPND